MNHEEEPSGLQSAEAGNEVDWSAVGRQYESLGYFAKSKGEQLKRIRDAYVTIRSAKSNLADIDEQIAEGGKRLSALLSGEAAK